MSYETEAATFQRISFTVVEIDFDNVINPGGTEYFCNGNVPLGTQMFPVLESISYSPTKITESGLGYRVTVNLTLKDFPHPSGVGTYFGRLLGANPFYIDRRITVWRGFENWAGFSFSNMKKGLYFIKKIDGPDDRGFVRITAADVLTLLDGDQAQYPPPSYGALAASLTNSATGSINIGDNTNIIAGTYVSIDDEICSVSGTTSTTHITLSGRGLFGTTAVAHDAGATVRRIAHIPSTNVVDYIYSLIQNGTPIDEATYINLTQWQAERDTYLVSDVAYGVIKEPTPVKQTISKICKEFNIAIWWDDETQLIKLKAIGPTIAPVVKLNTTQHILEDGEQLIRDQSRALSQVWINYGKRDHSGGDDLPNYAETFIYSDPTIEGASGLGKPMIEKINADYIPASGTGTASRTTSRMAAQRKFGVIEYKFRLDVKDATLSVGDPIEVTTEKIVGSDGYPVPTNMMITERARKETWVEYGAIVTGIEVGNRYGVIAPAGTPDYTSATTEQKAKYVWIASSATNQLSNGDAAYKML